MEYDTQSQVASIQGEIGYIMELLRTTYNEPARNALMERLRGLMRAMAELTGQSMPQQEAETQPEEEAGPLLEAPEGPPLVSGQESMRPAQGTRRVFTPEELALYNGTNGFPSYVAVNGIVYDVSNAPIWQTGTHFGLRAGQDLSLEFNTCHSNRPFVLDAMIPVGRLESGEETLI
ncbi:MAG TPA: cytochrome b5 domain-containing protein [Feifaniaceae bacterium]|nr:cytochrome b5 domain-containing protein [Feifaniaceae bacterium]